MTLLAETVHQLTRTQQYDGEPVTVRKRFGRETGWRWVEDQHPTR